LRMQAAECVTAAVRELAAATTPLEAAAVIALVYRGCHPVWKRAREADATPFDAAAAWTVVRHAVVLGLPAALLRHLHSADVRRAIHSALVDNGSTHGWLSLSGTAGRQLPAFARRDAASVLLDLAKTCTRVATPEDISHADVVATLQPVLVQVRRHPVCGRCWTVAS